MRASLITLLALFIFFSSEAQPHFKGCRHAPFGAKLAPLSKVEKEFLQKSSERSDTIDILNYDIQLTIVDFSGRIIEGYTDITFTPKLQNVSSIELNLLGFTVDSVELDGSLPLSFVHDGLFVSADFPPLSPGDTSTIRVAYHGQPTVSPGGFGGLDFQAGIAYNLGIGLGANPYNYGRGWYPCFDNFVERATYDFSIISEAPKRAHCSGTYLGEEDLGNNLLKRSFRLSQEIPSYLAGIAVGEFVENNDIHIGMNGDVPTQLLAAPSNIEAMIGSFEDLGGTIDALEFWFGPFAWEKAGYVTTAVGAMEHSTLIAYPTSVAIEGNTFRHRRLMAHELAHHWWGNVAGIPAASDMWFKEGNAEYGAHLVTEYLFGREAFIDQVKDNHLEVLQSAHIEDEGYWPLSGIPYEHTYGTHTYNKGACMMHNLRGYLGDDMFKTGMTSV
ncbi:MAG: hypothetical protein HKN16_04105, partial [Saprospiraceae bacterium]|nr:hypothetical protein [Saprospiraceae bacterium]